MYQPEYVVSNGRAEGVDFELELRGHVQKFHISREALEDHFRDGAKPDMSFEEIFRANSEAICAKADRIGARFTTGRLLIKTEDF
ncbi:hypothetical protein [Pandoraea sputorum]|uniref:hypothetical protein n=1 Tax=Pandoraea sputorum TaxID=93222 RepID=UPI001240E652|nr:hypothetical protein [Pandoraea sputorum]VVE07474.1 hypothetical protein PSP20601_02471 [Pandoraea sputorum]